MYEQNPPPLIKIFSKLGGVDRCSTPPSKIQGELRPPQPPLFVHDVRGIYVCIIMRCTHSGKTIQREDTQNWR